MAAFPTENVPKAINRANCVANLVIAELSCGSCFSVALKVVACLQLLANTGSPAPGDTQAGRRAGAGTQGEGLSITTAVAPAISPLESGSAKAAQR